MTKNQESLSTCSMDSFGSCLPSCEDVDSLIRRNWSAERLQAIGARWKLTDKEEGRLAELQHPLSDIRHVKNDPEEVVRFVRETHFLKGAERMFRGFIGFRIEQVDSILQDYHPDPVLKSHFPMMLLNGFDKDGDGIWVERPGVTDCYGLHERFGGKELLRYCLWARELACHSTWCQAYAAEKNQSPRMTCIVDLKGLNRGHVRPVLLPIFAELVQGIQNYYCGFIKKIIVIREPAIFGLVWSLLKHCFNANMKEMMVFAGSDYVNVLKEYIDDLEDVLPPCLLEGATGIIAEGLPQRLDGGPLPSKKSVSFKGSADEFNHTVEPSSLLEDSEVSASSSSSDLSPHQKQIPQTCDQTAIRLNPMTDRESMAVRCRLLVKGSF